MGVERRAEFRVWVEGQGTKKEIPDVGVERHAFGLALELQDGIRDRNLLAAVGVPCYAENPASSQLAAKCQRCKGSPCKAEVMSENFSV